MTKKSWSVVWAAYCVGTQGDKRTILPPHEFWKNMNKNLVDTKLINSQPMGTLNEKAHEGADLFDELSRTKTSRDRLRMEKVKLRNRLWRLWRLLRTSFQKIFTRVKIHEVHASKISHLRRKFFAFVFFDSIATGSIERPKFTTSRKSSESRYYLPERTNSYSNLTWSYSGSKFWQKGKIFLLRWENHNCLFSSIALLLVALRD